MMGTPEPVLLGLKKNLSCMKLWFKYLVVLRWISSHSIVSDGCCSPIATLELNHDLTENASMRISLDLITLYYIPISGGPDIFWARQALKSLRLPVWKASGMGRAGLGL